MVPALPFEPGSCARRLQRGLQILDALVLVEAVHQRERLLPFRFGLVGEVHARLLPPEQIRRDGDEALCRQLLAGRAQRRH